MSYEASSISSQIPRLIACLYLLQLHHVPAPRSAATIPKHWAVVLADQVPSTRSLPSPFHFTWRMNPTATPTLVAAGMSGNMHDLGRARRRLGKGLGPMLSAIIRSIQLLYCQYIKESGPVLPARFLASSRFCLLIIGRVMRS